MPMHGGPPLFHDSGGQWQDQDQDQDQAQDQTQDQACGAGRPDQVHRFFPGAVARHRKYCGKGVEFGMFRTTMERIRRAAQKEGLALALAGALVCVLTASAMARPPADASSGDVVIQGELGGAPRVVSPSAATPPLSRGTESDSAPPSGFSSDSDSGPGPSDQATNGATRPQSSDSGGLCDPGEE